MKKQNKIKQKQKQNKKKKKKLEEIKFLIIILQFSIKLNNFYCILV